MSSDERTMIPLRRLDEGQLLASSPHGDLYFLVDESSGAAQRIPVARAVALLGAPEAPPDPPRARTPRGEKKPAARPAPGKRPKAAAAGKGTTLDRGTIRDAVLWILTLDPHRPQELREVPPDLDLMVEAMIVEIRKNLAVPKASPAERSFARRYYQSLAREFREHQAGRQGG